MKTKWILRVLMFSFVLFVMSGCKFFGGNKELQNVSTPTDPSENYMIDAQVEQDSKKLIEDFFVEIYKIPMDEAYRSNVYYEIPESIEKFVAKSVLTEEVGKPELPIHYPRYLDIQGLSIYNYEVLTDENGPRVNSRFYEQKHSGSSYAFLTEVELKADVLSDADFNAYFSFNPDTGLYTQNQEIPQEKQDYIKIKARFDVWVEEDEGGMRVSRALEATSSVNALRLNRLNNEFIERLPFYDLLTLGENLEYQKEVGLLNEFFEKLFSRVNRVTSNNLAFEWDRNGVEFFDYMDQLGFMRRESGSGNPFFTDLLGDHKKIFHKDGLPIKPGMEKVHSISVSIKQHPGFRNLERVYRIHIEAFVETLAGGLTGVRPYIYEYEAKVSNQGEEVNIDYIRLNSYQYKR
jgi:hypothetical protein